MLGDHHPLHSDLDSHGSGRAPSRAGSNPQPAAEVRPEVEVPLAHDVLRPQDSLLIDVLDPTLVADAARDVIRHLVSEDVPSGLRLSRGPLGVGVGAHAAGPAHQEERGGRADSKRQSAWFRDMTAPVLPV